MPDLLTADGVRLHARVLTGHPQQWFVLAHGFSGSSATPALQRVAQRLSAYGTVLCYDARGHGRSAGLSTLGDREVLDVDAAVALARAQGARRVATVGFSMGGAAVVRHAAGVGGDDGCAGPEQRPDAVVVVSGTGPWSTWATASPAMRRVHLLVQTRPGRLVARYLLRTRVDPAGWAHPPVAPAACAADVRAPLLVVHGDRDHYLPVAHASALAAAPGAELWLEPGLGHAEVAVSGELVDRIGAYVCRVLA